MDQPHRRLEERTGEAFEGDIRLTVVGSKLLASGAGRVRVLHVVNSLDTPVCHLGAHRFETLRQSDLPPGVDVLTVSMDLPFAQARWRQAEGVEHEAVSSHRSEDFGRDYGVLLREWRLLQRAVFVIDRSNRVAYAEYVADQMAEPDYAAALDAARTAASR